MVRWPPHGSSKEKVRRVCQFLFLRRLLITDDIYSSTADPLVSYGRHFGRTVHALANVKSLITNGILRLGELAEEPEESFTTEYVHVHVTRT